MEDLYSKLFGLDDIAIEGGTNYRVKKAQSGEVYYCDNDGKRIVINNPKEVIWLNCKPSKYFPADK